MGTYFRWVATGPDLQTAKKGILATRPGTRAACWIFDLGAEYRPASGVTDDRVLVGFILSHAGDAILANQALWIRFPGSAFLGEAQHPQNVIVKSNEPGAYGIGQSLLQNVNACITGTRLAVLREVAKALGKPTSHAQLRMRRQKW